MHIKHLTFLFLCLVLLLCGCGGGGGEGGSTNKNTSPLATELLPEYKITQLLSGNQPILDLVVNDQDIFLMDGHTGDGIWRYNLAGGTPQVLVPKLKEAINIVAHGDSLYWLDVDRDKKIIRLYRSDTNGDKTVLLREARHDYRVRETLLVDDTAAFWLVSDKDNPYSSILLEKVYLDGSPPEILHRASADIMSLEQTSDHIYWLDQAPLGNTYDKVVFSLPKNGGTPQVLSNFIDDPRTNLVFHDDYLYVGGREGIFRVPSFGGNTEQLDDGYVSTISEILITSGLIYFSTNIPYSEIWSIQSMPISGGEPTKVVDCSSPPKNFVIKNKGLYWKERGEDGFVYSLKLLDLATFSVTEVASDIFINYFDLSLDSAYITEYDSLSKYTRLSKLSLGSGANIAFYEGVNHEAYNVALASSDNFLFFSDFGSIKKCDLNENKITTIFHDKFAEIKNIFLHNGKIYYIDELDPVLGEKIYMMDLDGWNISPITNDRLFSIDKVTIIENGYIYFIHSSSHSPIDSIFQFRRVSVNGGNSELLYQADTNQKIIGTEGSDLVYISEWQWNDRYTLIEHEIITGVGTELFEGNFEFVGTDKTTVFLYRNDGGLSERFYRVAKDGSRKSQTILSTTPPVINKLWNYGNTFYLGTSIKTEDLGTVTGLFKCSP